MDPEEPLSLRSSAFRSAWKTAAATLAAPVSSSGCGEKGRKVLLVLPGGVDRGLEEDHRGALPTRGGAAPASSAASHRTCGASGCARSPQPYAGGGSAARASVGWRASRFLRTGIHAFYPLRSPSGGRTWVSARGTQRTSRAPPRLSRRHKGATLPSRVALQSRAAAQASPAARELLEEKHGLAVVADAVFLPTFLHKPVEFRVAGGGLSVPHCVQWEADAEDALWDPEAGYPRR